LGSPVLRPTFKLSASAQIMIDSAKMNDYDQQKWFNLYRTVLLELKRAAMTG